MEPELSISFGAAHHSCRDGDDRTREGDKVTEFQAHRDCVSSCQFCYRDSVIVTASHDATLSLWHADDGRRLRLFTGHSDRIVGCIADEQHHRLLSASWDKSVALWDMNSSRNDMTWSASQDSLLTSCDLCTLHQLAVATTDGGHSHMWDLRSGQKITTIKGHTNTVMCCQFDSSGANLCTCSMDCTALVWDVRMWRQLLKLSGHTNAVSCCAFSHNSHWLVTGSWDKTLRVHNIATGTYRAEGAVVLSQHRGCVSSCDFAKDDSMFVSAGYDLDINIWCNDTHQLKNTYKGHSDWIKSVRFGENKKWIVTCAKDGVVRVWNTEAGSEAYRKGQSMLTFGLTLIKCQKCGHMFSPADNLKTQEQQCGVCVLCQSRLHLDQL